MADQEGVEVLTATIAAFNKGDLDAFADFMAKGGVYRQVGTNDVFNGPDGLKMAGAGWKMGFPGMNGQILSIIQSGDKVAATVRWTGTQTGPMGSPGSQIPPTGKAVDVQSSIMATVKAGKLTDMQNHFDMLAILKQLGVA